MATELPMACSLDPTGLEMRRRELDEIGAASLLGSERRGDAHLLRFRDDPETRSALEAIIRAESECCPFLDLTLDRGSGGLTLRVEAPEGGEPTAAAFAAALGAE